MTLRRRRSWMPENETLDICENACTSVNIPWQLGRRHGQSCRGVLLSQSTTACCDVQVRPSGWPTRYESWDTKLTYESGQTLHQQEVWLSAVGQATSRTWKTSVCGCSRRRNQELRMEKIRGTGNPADLLTKHLDGNRLTTLCDLIEYQASAEFISQADERHRVDRACITNLGSKDTGEAGRSKRNFGVFWIGTRSVDRWSEQLDERCLENHGHRYC